MKSEAVRYVVRRTWRRLVGVDRLFWWKVAVRSKLLRLRCVLMLGHTHVWTKLYGGGAGKDALICTRCRCHILEYRETRL